MGRLVLCLVVLATATAHAAELAGSVDKIVTATPSGCVTQAPATRLGFAESIRPRRVNPATAKAGMHWQPL
jgi:hypothetical protein